MLRSSWPAVPRAVALLIATTSALPACGSSDDATVSFVEPDAGSDVSTPTPEPAPAPTSESPAPATPPPGPPPFGGEVGQWTWVDVPESKCGNGQPTGFGVNVGTGSDLLIFLEGGGACWEEFSCAGIGIASYVRDGYTKATFEANYGGPKTNWILDRESETNPFKNASYVVVPYCTGDVHSGDAVQQFNFPPRKMHFAGRKNVEAVLSRIAPAFRTASRVTMSGSSAGGFGAALNYWRVKEAFGSTRVDMIDDSGPPFEETKIPLFGTWKSAWNMDGVFPPGCAECRTNVAALANYYSATYPAERFAFLSYDNDDIISLIFLSTQQLFAQNLRAVAENRLKALPNWRYFVVSGVSHTTLYNMKVSSGGVAVDAWLTQMTSDSPAWSNVAPF